MNALFLLSQSAHGQLFRVTGGNSVNTAPDNLWAESSNGYYHGKTAKYRNLVSELLGVPTAQNFGNVTVKVDMSDEIKIAVYTYYPIGATLFRRDGLSECEILTVGIQSISQPDQFVCAQLDEGKIDKRKAVLGTSRNENPERPVLGGWNMYMGESEKLLIITDCVDQVSQRWGYLIDEAKASAQQVVVLDYALVEAYLTSQKALKKALRNLLLK